MAKFMEVPHNAYLKLKLPGLKGIITISGDYKRSIECARDGSRLAKALVIMEEKRQLDCLVAIATAWPSVPAPPTQTPREASFQPSRDTKKVPLELANPKQCVTIGYHLDSK